MLGFLLTPAGKAVGGLLAIVAAIGAGYGLGRADGGSLAEKAVIERIVQENDHAGISAEDWRDRLRRCADAGGVFDFADGSCQR